MGIYICSTNKLDAGKTVLPVDLQVGALSEDGGGVVLIDSELMPNPGDFFPSGLAEVIKKIDALSPDREVRQSTAREGADATKNQKHPLNQRVLLPHSTGYSIGPPLVS